MNKKLNLRSMAAQAVEQVVEQGHSLSNVLPPLQQKVSDKDKALLQELCFGVLRTLSQLDWLINKLMSRPMTGKQRTVHYLIMVGFYQLLHTRIPPHAALAETVEGAVAIKRPQLKGLINGVLRQFQRQQEVLLAEFASSDARFLHPGWLLKRLQKAYPTQWEAIIDANNQRPPMWLRVNRIHHTRDSWLALLENAGMKGFTHPDYPDAIRLETAAPVHTLPGFDEGWVTVQDASAQGCVAFLAPQNGEHILDLCAAPGGKTTHILEAAPEANVLAVDVDEQRLSRVYDNLKRLRMKATVKQGDGRFPAQWCGEQQFDRILLDAPCSATGVIRRHPDIKWLRRDRDITELAKLQAEILDAVWPHLKSGGTLVYATCSVLPEENSQQVHAFLQRTTDAMLSETGTPEMPGLQNLPGAEDGDGFFYAKLIKK
ncbi:TPA: 16S rRNA (cytosine(967)-C(5))-methyltransferase RsmB [Citrobacter amalonaticus]|uniref:16S rRNA (cytosine(967)-C(5))-methyltransferase RsmB n=1 Tax=Citrobacter amalonaticus TaxID=35703 RepID=UPI0004D65B81|nr:16S rRNA (cytosine(967)-C(5))-methyltransferase RsmB [Citrobacter amalonaticus]KEY49640.1 16S rRNA methyltransferase [Citrobacter amalonaticus]MBJ9329593.1 16S rRNA (cytosine(967)-C(5))-methyltransferase RsmB [Citrobacter amalonaticus]MBY5254201.1 16S rRNA (cytosine(967)-C(5))-methyltransferase RsmB [Citrobacter amalonaticus]HAU4370802.1 16S rRNA (cytosine(967)-C(5))-methyltransferase RsmB [Citrobacter amalonaticus]HCD7970761.1 16S rRNA (cytosine(967)-C(5))-methyltransferase RsmB [Citrobact